MATLPASTGTIGRMPGRVSGAAPASPCGPCRGAGKPDHCARRLRLVLVCVLAMALALAPGCVVRSRGQYDVSVGKTSRS